MGNRFYVQPADFSGIMGGVGRGLEATYAANEQQAAQEKDKTDRLEAARLLEGGTPSEIRTFTMTHPDLTQEVSSSLKTKNEETKLNFFEMLKRARVNPELIPALAKSRIAFGKSQGLTDEELKDTATFEEKYNDDPEGTLKAIDRFIAFNSTPGDWKTYKDAVGLDEEEKDDRTTAIKEFEYGEKNPKFKLRQQGIADRKATKANAGKAFENSTKLRKEFLDQSKEYQKVRDSHTRVLVSTETPSPAGDLSLIFNYMKMLDPNSVVRESEFAQAAASGSFGERFKAAGEKLLTGERLTDVMRNDFVDKASVLYGGMQKQHTKREGSYRDIATKNGFDPNEVVIDLSEPEAEVVEYTEGQTATGPNGEKMIFSNGQWGVM